MHALVFEISQLQTLITQKQTHKHNRVHN